MSSVVAPASWPLKTQARSNLFSVERTQHDLLGDITDESDDKVDHIFGFAGRECDQESDLRHTRARYFDTAIGQCVSEDPIGFDTGDANLRRYVGNSSTFATDPSGLERAIQFPSAQLFTAADGAQLRRR